MTENGSAGEAFLRLQSGDVAGALETARAVCNEEPGNARAHLARGIALRMAGRLEEAREALERAAALAPGDHAPPYEIGIVRQLQGRFGDALPHFERSTALKPDFFAARFAAGLLHAQLRQWKQAIPCLRAVVQLRPDIPEAMLNLAIALERHGRHEEAEAAFVSALAAHPHHGATVKSFGQYSASRGNFRRAASLFAEALRLDPGDEALPMFLAQCELLLGKHAAAWTTYARRESRRRFEAEALARGTPYQTPALSQVGGRDLTLVGEQGLGDTLFFLRWAAPLRLAGARLHFSGDTRLHGILARSGLLEADDASATAQPVMVGDLPRMVGGGNLLPAFRVPPLPERLDTWRARLGAAGPRPWIGTLWRAGTPNSVVAHALAKSVPLEPLFAALAGTAGTVFALQRSPAPGELERAAGALGRPVHDLSIASEDPEDALAVTALLDRQVTVSNTNVHLAAAAGATAQVLVPYPPEWRWGLEGPSPWFPGFEVHRQELDGDWAAALRALNRPRA